MPWRASCSCVCVLRLCLHLSYVSSFRRVPTCIVFMPVCCDCALAMVHIPLYEASLSSPVCMLPDFFPVGMILQHGSCSLLVFLLSRHFSLLVIFLGLFSAVSFCRCFSLVSVFLSRGFFTGVSICCFLSGVFADFSIWRFFSGLLSIRWCFSPLLFLSGGFSLQVFLSATLVFFGWRFSPRMCLCGCVSLVCFSLLVFYLCWCFSLHLGLFFKWQKIPILAGF